jgi:ribosomal protein S27E
MRCRNCNLFKVLHNEECHTCAIERADKAEAKNKKFERYISFMVVSCPECGYERSSYSTPPSFNCSQCGCELEGES